MGLQKFKDIFDLTKQRINYTDADEIIDSIIKSGINQAYQIIAKNDEPLVSTAYVPIVNGVLELPDNLMDIVDMSPVLTGNYKKIGRNIITDNKGTITITYSYTPEPLVNDADVPEISSKYWYLLSTYACFIYFEFKKKPEIATLYYNEFVNGQALFKQKQRLTTKKRNYFVDLLGGDN